eukprot:gene35793-50741_t
MGHQCPRPTPRPGITACDLGATACRDPRLWTIAVLLADLGLIANMRPLLQRLFLGVRAEAAQRFGLYSLAGWRQEDVTQWLCGCANPPCGVAIFSVISDFSVMAMIFLLDFAMTRRFSSNLRGCVELAQTIAQCLARYDVATAELSLRSHDALRLPKDLRTAYEDLIANLLEYRPYLPDTILPHAVPQG